MSHDTKRRSFLKAASWRLLGTIDTFLISFIVTGELVFAFSISGIEVVTKLVLYFFHERLWNRIKYGKIVQVPDYQI